MTWPRAFEKRHNLTFPHGHKFVAFRGKHTRASGKSDAAGFYEFAVVGFSPREEKYICIEAAEHGEGGKYKYDLFSEKQITATAGTVEEPPVRFTTVLRHLPTCDERGQPVISKGGGVGAYQLPLEWPVRLTKRLNLKIQRGHTFINPYTVRRNGKDEFRGDQEYAVVGYNGREEKYVCIDAADHHDASGSYTFHHFTEKQILAAQPSGLRPPEILFTNTPRALPACDERGLVAACKEQYSTGVFLEAPLRLTVPGPHGRSSISSGAPSDHDARSPLCDHFGSMSTPVDTLRPIDFVASYDEWPKASKKLFDLKLDRGLKFTYYQQETKAAISTNRYGWLVKEWGKKGEEAVPGAYEYVVAGFDPREGRYLCFEAGNNRSIAVRFSGDEIRSSLNTATIPTECFRGRYPPLPEFDSRTLIIRGFERPAFHEDGANPYPKPSQLLAQPPRKRIPRDAEAEINRDKSDGSTEPPSRDSSGTSHPSGVCTPPRPAVPESCPVVDAQPLRFAPGYPFWGHPVKSKYGLKHERGLCFTATQHRDTAKVEKDLYNWLVKRWGMSGEWAAPGIYEYVIMGYNGRTNRYLCFEAMDVRKPVIEFSESEIKEALRRNYEAHNSFKGKYPALSTSELNLAGSGTNRGEYFGFRRTVRKMIGHSPKPQDVHQLPR